jgi:1,4-alpha-glucan branching enzyme
VTQTLGSFCLVLHTHLPWLNHHGSWPVGEEWLYQAWASSYDPLLEVLERLALSGQRDILTLGITPVLAAQLDDPYTRKAHQTWLSDWFWRATEMTTSPDPKTRELGSWEAGRANAALARFEKTWQGGGSPGLRPLVDAGVIELLGGPAAHPFQPLRDERMVRFQLELGLDDAQLRLGRRPAGIWAPECGYRPGLAQTYADAGISHFMMDGPSLRHVGVDTYQAHPIGDTGVMAFGRDLDVTYRVWSPKSGYPGGKWYRDFHTHNHEYGFRHSRVTSRTTPSPEKLPYDPDRAQRAVSEDVSDFVATVVRRLSRIQSETGRPGMTVSAYDTELFGHWWSEGPIWLEQILTELPKAGVNVTTLQGAIDAGHVGAPIEPENGSWGLGKDWHIWDGPAVSPMVADLAIAESRVLDYLKGVPADGGRNVVADQLVRNLVLAQASDWAFMVSHDSAAGYAWQRHHDHVRAVHALADCVTAVGWDGPTARELAERQNRTDGPFGHLDARRLA